MINKFENKKIQNIFKEELEELLLQEKIGSVDEKKIELKKIEKILEI